MRLLYLTRYSGVTNPTSILLCIILVSLSISCRKESNTQKRGNAQARLFKVAIETTSQTFEGPKFGCNDKLVPFEVPLQYSGRKRLELLIRKLFTTKGKNGLANRLYGAKIKIRAITIYQNKAEIKLSGKFIIKGTCDIPRIKKQLHQTVLQNSNLNEVTFYIDDKTLDQYLSLKG